MVIMGSIWGIGQCKVEERIVMFEVVQISTKNRRQVRDFIEFQYDHYKDCEYFVPPLPE